MRNKKTLLFSPLPPLRTGTADYSSQILHQLRRANLPLDSLKIVVDPTQFENLEYPRFFKGYEVVPHSAVSDVVNLGETRIFTLANNLFHSYCYRKLASQRGPTKQQVFSIVHEPSCFMLLNNICHNGIYGFSPQHLRKMGEVQFGEFSAKIVDDLNAGNLHWSSEYSFHFQDVALRKCGTIFTHSLYAALKLTLESNLPKEDLPTFEVLSHPSEDDFASSLRAQENEFRIGMFGWVARAKRTEEVIKAFSLFRYMLTEDEKSRVKLVVVGASPDPGYQPQALARRYEVEEAVEVHGYVTASEMDAQIARCSLIFNLRYPSCGETSGTLQKAVDLNIPVVTSAYQAFRELPSARKISISPADEIREIRDAMYFFFKNPAEHIEHIDRFRYKSIVNRILEISTDRRDG